MGEILIAYERETELETLDGLLTARGHRVRRAMNGVEALEAVRTAMPDLILADINLPKLDGFALCRRLKQDELLQSVPFVFYSRRYDDPKYERFAHDLGADRFLGRTVPPVAVLAAVDELLVQVETKINATAPLPMLDDSTVRRLQESEHEHLSQLRLREQLADASAAQARLAASEERFRRLFNLNPVPMWIVDQQSQGFIAVNDSALAKYGYERGEFLRLKQRSLYATEEIAASASSAADEPVRHRMKDGTPLALLLTQQPLEFDGQAALMVCAFDVSDRVQLERSLQAELEDYRARLESAVDGYWLLHDDGRLLDVNDAYCRLSGYDRATLLTMSAADIEAHASGDTTLRLRNAREGRIERYETQHRRQDGTLCDVEVSAGAVRSGGNDSGRTIVLIRDVTARQREISQQSREQAQLKFLIDLFASVDGCDATAIVRRTVEQAALVGSSPLAFWYFVDDARRTLSLAAWREHEKDFTVSANADPRAWSRGGWVLECAMARSPLVTNDRAPKQQGDGLPELNRICLVPLLSQDKTIAVLGIANRTTDYTSLDQQILAALGNGIASVLDIKRTHAESLASLKRADVVVEQLVNALLAMIEVHDPYTAGSARRVAALTLALGRELQLDDTRSEALRVASLLHDIGNVTVPANLLGKPAALNDLELQLVRSHSSAGWQLLSQINFGTPVAEIVHQHHERFDGSGYPRALKGEALLLEASILAVADTVEAMSAARPHRAAFGLDAALEEIERGAGRLYDPHVVAACTRLIRQYGFQLPM